MSYYFPIVPTHTTMYCSVSASYKLKYFLNIPIDSFCGKEVSDHDVHHFCNFLCFWGFELLNEPMRQKVNMLASVHL